MTFFNLKSLKTALFGSALFLATLSYASSEIPKQELAKATFAGGCFWCMQPVFDKVEGVSSTVVGYTGGKTHNPTYEQVSKGKSGHLEAIEITYDPTKVTYKDLLHIFWRNIDPTSKERQFCDKGDQFQTAIFYHDEAQQAIAEESKQALMRSAEPIVTEILPAKPFHPASDVNQKFYEKNPIKYQLYLSMCKRDQRLKEIASKIPALNDDNR